MASRLFAMVLLVSAMFPMPTVAASAPVAPRTSTPVAVDAPSTPTVTNLVSNGSFEDTLLTTANKVLTAGDASEIAPWTLVGTADLVTCGDGVDPSSCVPSPTTAPITWAAKDGAQSIDIASSNHTGTISQTIATPVGHTFTLRFWYLPGPRSLDKKADSKVNISFGGTKVTFQAPLETRDANGANVWYEAVSVPLAATTEQTTLSFKGIAGKTFGFAIDDVQVVDDSAIPDPVEVAAPELYRASPSGSSTGDLAEGSYAFSYDTSKLKVLGVADYDPGTYNLSFYAGASCPAIDAAAQSPIATWAVTITGSEATPVFVTGDLDLGGPFSAATPFVAAKVTGPASTPGVAGKVSPLSNCVVYSPENDTWVRAVTIPAAGSVNLGNWVDEPGIGRWFKVDVDPGSSVTMDLTALPADFDVYLFKDIAKSYVDLTGENDLVKLNAEFAGSGFSGSGFSGSGFSGSGFSGSGFSGSGFSADSYSGSGFSGSGFSGSGFSGSGFSGSGFSGSGFSGSGFSGSGFSGSGFSGGDFSGSGFSGSGFSAEDYSAAQYYSLLGWSTNIGTADEQVGANTWTATGDFYIRVNGKNGASSTDSSFALQGTIDSSVCDSVTAIGSAPGSIANSASTLIVTDTSRIPGADAAFGNKLEALATATGGVVIDLAGDGRVQGLSDQADANPACVHAKNLVASAMKDVVDAYRSGNPGGVQYVVLVGGDDAVPFFRYPDLSSLAPEANFYPPVDPDTTSEGSLRSNYVLGQDGYGSTKSIAVGPVDFPVPGIAVGRLVENATEISGMIDAYLSITPTDGVRSVRPSTSAVTGYDFIADTAAAVKANFDAATGESGGGDALIQPYGEAPDGPNTWSGDQLADVLLGQRNDITFLAGHFSASSALAADYETVFTTSQLDAAARSVGETDVSKVDLVNTLLLSIGCHSGYNIVDGHAIPGVTQPLDWPQVFARKGITSILGTGYQYGDTEFLEYSERIYAELSKQLRYDTSGTAVALGDALVASKVAYLSQTYDLEDLHVKSLLEAGLYGLPMLGVDFQNGRLGTPPGGSIGVTLPGDPQATGLKWVDVSKSTPSDGRSKDLNVVGGGTLTATWYEGADGVYTEPGAPALPLQVENVTPNEPNYVLRGVGFRGGTYEDMPVVPLSGAPATELQTAHTSFDSPVFYPSLGAIGKPNYWGLLSGGNQSSLLLTPAQHKAIQPGQDMVNLRLYTGVDVRLYYINSDATGIKSLPPVVFGVTSDAGTGSVSVRVLGDDTNGAGIHEVWVTYTTPGSGTWTSFDLTQDETDTAIWNGNRTLPSGTRFVVQAANSAGTVTLNDNFGAYYLWGVDAANLPSSSLALAGPSGGTYGTTATVNATLTSGGSPIANELIIATVGSVTRSGITGADGTVSIALPISSASGAYALTASFLGDGAYQSSGDSYTFTINKAESNVVVTCPANVPFTGSAQEPCTARVVGTTPLDDLDQPLPVTYANNTAAGSTATASAEFYGDAAHVADSGSAQFSIGKIAQTITFGPLAGKMFGDTAFTLSATASSGLAVTFSSDTTDVCTVDGATVTIASVGECTITASQDGNSEYAAALPVSQSFSIGRATATLTLDANDLAQTYNATRAVDVTTDPAGLTGVTVEYESATYPSSTTPPTEAGSYAVTAILDHADYTATPATGTLVIAKANQSISFDTLVGKTYGEAPFTVSATATSGLAVSFEAAGDCTVSEAEVTITGAGSCTITAKQAGDGNWNAATSVSRQFSIAKASASLSLVTADLAQTYTGSPLSVGVTKDPAALDTVTMTYESATYGPSTTAPTNAGSYTVTATLTNDDYAATPATDTLVIAKATSTTVITCPSTGQTYTGSAITPCSAAVTGAGGLSTTATVTYGSNTDVGTATADASYGGDANHEGSTADQATFEITKASTTTTITCPSSVSFTGSALTPCTANVTGAGLTGVTVTVLYADNLNPGTATADATYAGDANHTGSTATQATFQILSASFTLEYTGSWFQGLNVAPTLSARLMQDQSGTPLVDYSVSTVNATFRIYPAACASLCSTTATWTSAPVRVNRAADWEATGAGTVSVAGLSTLAEGAYIVVVSIESNVLVSAKAATAGLAITPSSGTFVVGGGYLPVDSTATAGFTKGFFAFNVRRSGNTGTGGLVYVYRELRDTATGQACATAGGTCRAMDVVIRSTGVTSVTTTKSATWPVTGTSIGTVSIRFIDPATGAEIAGMTPLAGSYRLDATDNAPGGTSDTFGLSVYAGSSLFHQALVGSDQTDTNVAAAQGTIDAGDISAPPGNR